MKTSLIAAAALALALSPPAPAQDAPEARADAAAAADAAPQADAALDAAIAGAWRTPDNVARDRHRHPRETLAFFGVAPGQTIVEITPGGGWYTEILAPYLRASGRYVGAVVDPARAPERGAGYYARARDELQAKIDGEPRAAYDRATLLAYDPNAPVFGEPGSADRVLTFRNVHNWRASGQAEGMFKAFFDVLKPGGVLGVVEHRAKRDVPADDKSGYVGEAQVIALAEAAGFVLDGSSEVNANPKDDTDHPNGVWTLPPGNRHDAEDRQRYAEIGESDRMTLRFVKK